MTFSQKISFTASAELATAIDIDAYSRDEARAVRIRGILAEHLRSVGALGSYDPLTFQLSGEYTHRANSRAAE